MNLPIIDTIAARTLLVLIVGLTVSHIFSVALYFSDRTNALNFAGGEHVAESMVTISRLIDSTPKMERNRIVSLLDEPILHVIRTAESAVELRHEMDLPDNIDWAVVTSRLGAAGNSTIRLNYTDRGIPELWLAHFEQHSPYDAGSNSALISIQLSDGDWLNFAAPIKIQNSVWSLRFGLSIGVMLLSVIIFSALIVRSFTKPLKQFSTAAHRLGTDVNAPPLPVTGPLEVRQATSAFNEMQLRVRRFVEDHTQMIAAISHDLGTPITRLRLRAEFIEDEEQKNKMLADLDDMEKMVFSTLSFAREESKTEPMAMVDLRTLVQRVCDDLVDLELAVDLSSGVDRVPYRCRPAALRRALTNLIENAVKYGSHALVKLDGIEETVRITIEDNGPGIPSKLLEDVFQPFQRLERSRNRETGGTGLGLTTARTIVRSHGGDIILKNREEGGLCVEVILPR